MKLEIPSTFCLTARLALRLFSQHKAFDMGLESEAILSVMFTLSRIGIARHPQKIGCHAHADFHHMRPKKEGLVTL